MEKKVTSWQSPGIGLVALGVISKDLGHQNQGLEKGSILGIFINDIAEYLAAVPELKKLQQPQRLTEAE
jgi:hypothetical protein